MKKVYSIQTHFDLGLGAGVGTPGTILDTNKGFKIKIEIQTRMETSLGKKVGRSQRGSTDEEPRIVQSSYSLLNCFCGHFKFSYLKQTCVLAWFLRGESGG